MAHEDFRECIKEATSGVQCSRPSQGAASLLLLEGGDGICLAALINIIRSCSCKVDNIYTV